LTDRLLGVRAFGVLDEREPAGPAGFTVERSHDLRRFADLRKMLAQIVFGGLIREISNEQTNWWHGTRGRAG
jgi:hypothetical protein